MSSPNNPRHSDSLSCSGPIFRTHVNLDDKGYHLPEFDVPEGYDAHSYLCHLCEKGLAWRYGEERARTDEALRVRLEHELGIINRMGFDTYFLIVWDLCEWAVRSDDWYEMHQDPFPYDSYQEWKDNYNSTM